MHSQRPAGSISSSNCNKQQYCSNHSICCLPEASVYRHSPAAAAASLVAFLLYSASAAGPRIKCWTAPIFGRFVISIREVVIRCSAYKITSVTGLHPRLTLLASTLGCRPRPPPGRYFLYLHFYNYSELGTPRNSISPLHI